MNIYENEIALKAKQLCNFIDTLKDFTIDPPDVPYNHMGATITDSMLQAGLKWESVVKPRLDKLKKGYPAASTTTGFLRVLEEVGVNRLLEWKDSEKPNRVFEATKFFIKEGIEAEPQLKVWLERELNLSKLRKLRGIGNKTVDYFRWLAGIPTTAIDRHMIEFLRLAGIDTVSYFEAKDIINTAADLMYINRTVLDHSIWKYMSQSKSKKRCESVPRNHNRKTDVAARINPHQGHMEMIHPFNDVWDYLDNEGLTQLKTSERTAFEASAGISRNDEPVIRFFQNGKEYARAYECCWGHYYNCNRTRFGMYAKALDDFIGES